MTDGTEAERVMVETLDEARLRRAKRIAETVCGQPGDIEYVAAILAAHEEDVRAGERRAAANRKAKHP